VTFVRMLHFLDSVTEGAITCHLGQRAFGVVLAPKKRPRVTCGDLFFSPVGARVYVPSLRFVLTRFMIWLSETDALRNRAK
jgi:hypothetical protein